MNYNDEVQKKRANSKLQLKVIENKKNSKENSNRKELLKKSDIDVSNEIFDPIKEEVMNKIFIENNCIYAIVEKYNPSTKSVEEIHKRLTNFLIEYESRATFENLGIIKYKIKINKNGKIVKKDMPSSALTDSKTIKKYLSENFGTEYIFNGNDNELNLLKEYLAYQKYDEKIGIEKLGMFKNKNGEYKFVDSSNEIKEYQKQDDYSGLKANLFESELINKEELKQLSKFLFCWNDLENTIPTVLFPICCLLKPKFNNIGIKLFHLFAVGERGSGKSTAIETVIMPMMGMGKDCINQAGTTEFAGVSAVSRSNVFPVIFEEFKPYKMNKNKNNIFSSLLRSSYDSHTIIKGQQSLKIRKWELTSPLVVVGEANTDESAVIDRSINLNFHKLNHNPIGKHAARKLLELSPILTKLNKSILEYILNLDDEILKEKYFKYLSITETFQMNSRKQEHCSKLLVAMEILENVYKSVGLELQEECRININLFKNILQETQSDIESKSIVETTLELYDLNYRSLMEGWDFKFNKDKTEIAIDVKNTYHKITKFYNEHGLTQEILSIKDFTKQLRTSKYFVDYKPVKLLVAYESVSNINDDDRKESKKSKKCFILNCELLIKHLEFENLLKCDENEPEEQF